MNAGISYIAVIFIWATSPIAIKFSVSGFSPFAAISWRIALAVMVAALMVALFYSEAGLKKRNWRAYAAASLAIFPTMPIVYVAANYVPSGLISVLFGTTPFIMGLLSMVILGEQPFSKPKVLGLLLSLGGVILVALDQLSLGEGAFYGVLLLCGSNVVWSLSNILVKKFSVRVNSFEQTLGAMAFSLPGLLLCWGLTGADFGSGDNVKAVWAILYLAFVGSLLGFLAFYNVLQHMPVATVSLIPVITPLLAVFVGISFGGEHLSKTVLAGTGLIVFGLAVHEFLPRLLSRKGVGKEAGA